MNIHRFFEHHGITDNPFLAEEARHDPVFTRLMDSPPAHPDFEKIMGELDNPSTAVVFGEKGSGKTAIRMLIARKLTAHNQRHADRRMLLVAYDDLNPVLDRLLERRRQELGFRRAVRAGVDHLLNLVRLEDHQDAILSRAVTRIVDEALGGGEKADANAQARAKVKRLPRHQRVNLAVLAALYDQSPSGGAIERWGRLLSLLRVRGRWSNRMPWLGAFVLTMVAVAMACVDYWPGVEISSGLAAVVRWAAIVPGVSALWLWGVALSGWVSRWSLARKIRREMVAVDRQEHDLREMLGDLKRGDLAHQPLPHARPGQTADAARYQLTEQFMELIGVLGYRGMLVLIDRIDEPTVVSGQTNRMQAVIWPMFDHKFLQQRGIGIKLMLPIELRHVLHRQTREFFQEARLDKQHLVDRLSWSGATLYDLCCSRLTACRGEDGEPAYLTQLFDEDVTAELLIDALDQMQQPRDAFKFLYNVIQEHCRNVPDERPSYRIPRLTLEAVRRQQTQRVQDVHQGVSPG